MEHDSVLATPVPVRDRFRAATVSLVIIATIAAFGALIAAEPVLAPTVFALVLALALAPIASALEKFGFSPSIAAVLSVVTAVAAIGAIGFSVTPLFADLIGRAPDIIENVNRKILPIRDSLSGVGDAAEEIGAFVEEANRGEKVQTVKIAGPSAASSFVRIAPAAIGQVLYVILFAIFVLAGRRDYRLKIIASARGVHERLRTARIIRDIGEKVSDYLFVITVINICLGIAAASIFAAIGLEDPFLWGVAFGIGNFVPVIGAAAIIVASAIVGLASHDSLVMALAGPAVLLALNIVEGNIIQPIALSRRIVVNPLAIFASFALFAWMWGPVATFIATPALVALAVIARHTPGMKPVSILLANEAPPRGKLAAYMAQARAKARAARAAAQTAQSPARRRARARKPAAEGTIARVAR